MDPNRWNNESHTYPNYLHFNNQSQICNNDYRPMFRPISDSNTCGNNIVGLQQIQIVHHDVPNNSNSYRPNCPPHLYRAPVINNPTCDRLPSFAPTIGLNNYNQNEFSNSGPNSYGSRENLKGPIFNYGPPYYQGQDLSEPTLYQNVNIHIHPGAGAHGYSSEKPADLHPPLYKSYPPPVENRYISNTSRPNHSFQEMKKEVVLPTDLEHIGMNSDKKNDLNFPILPPQREYPHQSSFSRSLSPRNDKAHYSISSRREASPTSSKYYASRSPSRNPIRKRDDLPPKRRPIARRPAYRTQNRSSTIKRTVSRNRKLHRPLPSKCRGRPRQSHTNSRSSRDTCRTTTPDYKRRTNGKRNIRRRLEKKKTPEKKPDYAALLEEEKKIWTRTSPAELFYTPGSNYSEDLKIVQGTEKQNALCNEFDEKLLKQADAIRANLPKYEPLQRKKKILSKHKGCCSSSSSSSSSESDGEEDHTNEELEHKKKHPLRLHPELWFNDPGEMNDGPLCRCSAKAQRSGIRHNIYAGENHLTLCDPNSNNADRLHHYRITVTPVTNFLIQSPTVIMHDGQEYLFEGFSMFTHKKLDELPLCKVIRYNIEYTILYYEEKFPQNFTVKELNLFYNYLFKEILELVDLDFHAAGDKEGCPQYHFMPRFVRGLEDNGKEILSMNVVLKYLLQSSIPLIPKEDLSEIKNMPQHEWQRFTENIKGMIVTYPGKKPSSLRVDQLDRDEDEDQDNESDQDQDNESDLASKSTLKFPEIVHFGIRPPQLSYAGNPEYQKAWREYVKFRHLMANMPKPSFNDKEKLELKEIKLQSMRTKSELKRNVTVTVSSENFRLTGIMCDVVQHAMLIPVLVSHLRFHRSLDVLEESIHYKFEKRYRLQLAMTHPSYRENFGTNPDHARNALTNCGIRQPKYGDRKIHYQNTRKRGINTLVNIMSQFGEEEETESEITHNERLEFLGDAVVEFVSSVHLFHLFCELEEGGLATYRAAIVQNQHLALLAKILHLEEFMLYAHGSDLCHDLELRHAMANCFEALMGALFLDGGIEVADKVFGQALFKEHTNLLEVWVDYPPHPLQEQEPLGDRKWIPVFELLQKLTKFEESTGIYFDHIRLLARAFTDRSMGYTHLTLGSNQRLEFLGDTVLQLITSEFLYKHFPKHHEGHLSLLRSALVNNRTQSIVCDDLGMAQFTISSNPKAELKTKDRADLLEAFLGALYVDKDLDFCKTFCDVCFFPRLKEFILKQDWNDPKSKLQQCCLTLRTMEGGEPEIPVYKVVECMGPTNTRIYSVAVYFKNQRLAKSSGHSIQQAEMNAAKNALKNSEGLFPQLDHQRRVISKTMNHQKQGGNTKTSPLSTKDTKGDVFSKTIRSRTPPLAYRSRNKSPSPKMSSEKEEKKEEPVICKPSTSKVAKDTKGDVFSKTIRSRTPPLAYRSRNKSPSPKMSSEKEEKKEEPVSCKPSTSKVSPKATDTSASRLPRKRSQEGGKRKKSPSPIPRPKQKKLEDKDRSGVGRSSPINGRLKSNPMPVVATSTRNYRTVVDTHVSRKSRRSRSPVGRDVHRRKLRSISKETESRNKNLTSNRSRRSKSKSPRSVSYSTRGRRSPVPRRHRSPKIPSRSINYRSRSRSPRSPPRNQYSDKKDLKKNMSDFLLGKRSSPGIETRKAQNSTSWLFDIMYGK
ncbi:ribonuclease 3 [Macrosteles quadrilineatus]|uniref:ribonuclease 3 n=1 Tax=Macrosteles quadrilineatus TaxID=74068 RepID=UPI0023E0EC78|nr:ribonuclease 3 [Macrosteles quadrilineatus]